MLFDNIVGNPPYQGQPSIGQRNYRAPIYPLFMQECYLIGAHVALIHPGRILFETGGKSKSILSDTHLTVKHYEASLSSIFQEAEVAGGIAITLRNRKRFFGSIGVFIPFPELKHVHYNVTGIHNELPYMNSMVAPQGLYRFTSAALEQYPRILTIVGKGTSHKIVSRMLPKLPEVFSTEERENTIRILGFVNQKRQWYYVDRSLLQDNPYMDTYNVFVPETNGKGAFDAFSTPIIGCPSEATADTFLSIGTFNSYTEAKNLLAYVKTKFLRALLGIRKATQHNPAKTWCFVPVQDFTEESDIDWSLSIPEIDQQLYKKYRLKSNEIRFIEKNVKEMI